MTEAMIYFDNAATTLPKPPGVAEAVVDAMAAFGGAGRGGHGAAVAADRCLYRARCAVGGLFGAGPDQIAFTPNATEALNIAIAGLLGPADHAITTVMEHNSVLRPLYRLREAGMGLDILPLDDGGKLDYSALSGLLTPRTRAVVCTHASNLTGQMVDLARMGDFCRVHGLLLIVDASQTAGVYPIDMAEFGIDVLCFTGHKGLMGPQGTGGLCVRPGLSVPSFKVGGSGVHSFDERHPAQMPETLEAGTPNAHGIAGLLAAVSYINATGMDVIRGKELEIAAAFREGASAIPGVVIYGDPAGEGAPIVALNVGDMDSAAVSDRLWQDYRICTRPGAHCAPLMHRAIGTEGQGAVRFSFSSFNEMDEVATAIEALRAIAREAGV